jgi:rapamycin-insensitive companion of mTOR
MQFLEVSLLLSRHFLFKFCAGVLNPEAFISCGGVSAVIRNLLDCQMPRIAESLCGILLFLLNNPATRSKAGICLQSLAAPYCDFHLNIDRNR